jgi:gliding motility-associated-like protein
VLSNVAMERYSFTIIDRWGQIIYETSDTAEGWDGKIAGSGKDATSDIFQYELIFYDQNNDKFIKRGSVALLR